MHPARDQPGLAFHDGLKQREAGPLGVAGVGKVAIDDVVGKTLDRFEVAARGEILEGSDTDVARCDAGQHGSRQLAIAIDRFPGRDGGQRPRGRDSERMHRLADEIFAQDRPQRGAAVSASREWRSARALQLDVPPLAVAIQDLAEEDRAAVAELGNEVSELMARHRPSRSARRPAARRCRQTPPPTRRVRDLARLNPSSEASASLNAIRPRLRGRRRIDACEKMLRKARVAVGEDDDGVGRAFDGRRFLHGVSRRHGSQATGSPVQAGFRLSAEDLPERLSATIS